LIEMIEGCACTDVEKGRVMSSAVPSRVRLPDVEGRNGFVGGAPVRRHRTPRSGMIRGVCQGKRRGFVYQVGSWVCGRGARTEA